MHSFNSLNEALVGMSKELLEKGVTRETRGVQCVELPYPVIIEIKDPTNRYVTVPQRQWNKKLPFAESVWLLSGSNTLNDLPGLFTKSLFDFSDDGKTWRAGYSPRIRKFSTKTSQYDESIFYARTRSNKVDQFKFVLDSMKRDINTRQACICIADPNKDCFYNGELIVTKDMPCTRELHFMMSNDGKLNLYGKLRSNDILWGLSAINIFNFCWMQELVASILKVPVGSYYHMVDNLHFYKKTHNGKDFEETLRAISNNTREQSIDKVQAKYSLSDKPFSLAEMDNHICSGMRLVGDYMQDMYSETEVIDALKETSVLFPQIADNFFALMFSKNKIFIDCIQNDKVKHLLLNKGEE